MRHVVIAGACALFLGTSAAASAQAPAAQKFAYVNSQLIFQAAPGRAEAQAQFDKDIASFRSQVQKLGDSLQALQQQYNKDEVSLSPTAKEARQKTLRDKEAEYQDRVQKLNDQASARQAELMQPVLDIVQKVLDDIRTEDGYTFIFDVGNETSFIVAADKNLDISDRVIARLKTVAPPKAQTGYGSGSGAGRCHDEEAACTCSDVGGEVRGTQTAVMGASPSPPPTLRRWSEGELIGDGSIPIRGVAPLDRADQATN